MVKTMSKAQLSRTSPPSNLTGALTHGEEQLFSHDKACTARDKLVHHSLHPRAGKYHTPLKDTRRQRAIPQPLSF